MKCNKMSLHGHQITIKIKRNTLRMEKVENTKKLGKDKVFVKDNGRTTVKSL